MKKTQIYFFLEELNSINIPLLKKLKNREIFEVDYNEDVLFKEMRRREIKRYKSSNN